MCDCYSEKCKRCDKEIPIHLSDYSTDRDEIEVFCESCLPSDRKNGILWKYRDSNREPWEVVFIRALTENARNNESGNHPNMSDIEVIGVPEGCLEVIDEKPK